MEARHEELRFETRGDGDVIDLTPDAQKFIYKDKC